MFIKPYLAAITEEIDGVKRNELIHEMSEIRLRDIMQRRDAHDHFYYQKEVRGWAANELDRREKNSAVARTQADFEFRQEVINSMLDAGISEQVALKLTSNPENLFQQAKLYGVI